MRYVPTTESQLKYVTLCFFNSENFHYPNTTKEIYEEIKQQFDKIEKAVHFLASLDHDKVMNEIATSGGIVIEENSKGDHQDSFIMLCNKDKIEQLMRECYKDRPKTEVDLNLITSEKLTDEKIKKREEEKKKNDEEKYKQRKTY